VTGRGVGGIVLGVGVVVEREGRYLLGLRRSALGFGTWGFPGGHVEVSEDPLECAKRELREETGMELMECHRAGWFSHDDAEQRYVTLYVVAKAAGEPSLCEPQKCERWQWFRREDLPAELFLPTAGFFQL
jgi:8-oxo-dGTP diphosphatase